jgi:hypothetical protein
VSDLQVQVIFGWHSNSNESIFHLEKRRMMSRNVE